MTARPRNLWPPELTEALRAERDRDERDEGCTGCGLEPCECDPEGVTAEEMEELGC